MFVNRHQVVYGLVYGSLSKASVRFPGAYSHCRRCGWSMALAAAVSRCRYMGGVVIAHSIDRALTFFWLKHPSVSYAAVAKASWTSPVGGSGT